MKRFPFSRLRPKAGWITASVYYNPYCDLPPMVRHTISVDIEPLKLGRDAAMPEYEKVVDSGIIFSGLVIDGRAWNGLSGTHVFDERQDGSFYVSSAHNPVTVRELILSNRQGTKYDVDAMATFHFEFEGSGYAEETTRLVFSANHRGFYFSVPRWTTPDEVTFPAEWAVPSTEPEWPPSIIRDFVERYCDLSQYAKVTIEDSGLSAQPTVPKQKQRR